MSTADDTRQRSVAEIIGWTTTDKDEWWEDLYLKPDGSEHQPTFGPSVDDMLEWLRLRGWSGVVNFGLEVDGACIAVAPDDSLAYADIQEFTAPTLHAALEAAVRAVAEVSDE